MSSKFWIMLGVVSTLTILVLADSDAKSDPGQTHYVNAGFSQGFKLGHPANLYASDVNQYGYKHSYSVEPRRKTYGYRPAAVQLLLVQPLPHPVQAPVPLAHPVPHAVSPAPQVHPVPHAVTPAPQVHPVPHTLTPAPQAIPVAHSVSPTPFVHRPVTPQPFFQPSPTPFVVLPTQRIPEAQPAPVSHQEAQPFAGGIRFPPHPVFDRLQPQEGSTPLVPHPGPLPLAQQLEQQNFHLVPQPAPVLERLPAPEAVQAPVQPHQEVDVVALFEQTRPDRLPISEPVPENFPVVESVPATVPVVESLPLVETERVPVRLPVLEAVPTLQLIEQEQFDPRFAPGPPPGAQLAEQGPPPSFFGFQELRQGPIEEQELILEDPAPFASNPSFPSLPAFPAVPL